MRRTLRMLLSLGLVTAFLAATHLCSLKSLFAEDRPSCHASTAKASSDCCARTSGPAQGKSAESKCCLAPADQPSSVRALWGEFAQLNPERPDPIAKRWRSGDRVKLRPVRDSGPPFFVTYVLQHTYSLHAPPVVL